VPAPVVAETIVTPEDRQVPLPFELRYDWKRIDPKRTYAVRAMIRSGGQILFSTTTVARVLTQGNPSRVDLMLMNAGGQPQAPQDGIWGTSWLLEDLGGLGVVDRVQATLEFPEPGKAVGNGSCNRFFGPVQISGESMTFGPLGSTRKACVEAVMTQESRYLKALQDAERYALDGSTLLIFAKGQGRPLRFTRSRPSGS
jgi:heat shock protein HslJ